MASNVVNGATPSNADQLSNAVKTAAEVTHAETEDAANSSEIAQSPTVKAAPKSWADLVRTMRKAAASGTPQASQETNGPMPQVNGFAPTRSGSLADALSSYSIKESNGNAKIAFLEPRGLVNTGNMCYMNSVSWNNSPKCWYKAC